MSNQFLEGICSSKDVLPCQLLLAHKRGGLTMPETGRCLHRFYVQTVAHTSSRNMHITFEYCSMVVRKVFGCLAVLHSVSEDTVNHHVPNHVLLEYIFFVDEKFCQREMQRDGCAMDGPVEVVLGSPRILSPN